MGLRRPHEHHRGFDERGVGQPYGRHRVPGWDPGSGDGGVGVESSICTSRAEAREVP